MLRQEVTQERRMKTDFGYRDDIFTIAEGGNGNFGTLSRHWKFVANQSKSPFLIEGWVVPSGSTVFFGHRIVQRTKMVDTVKD